MTTVLDRLRAKYPSKEVLGDVQVILKVGHTLSFPKIFDGGVRDHYHTFEAGKAYTIYPMERERDNN